VVGTVPYWEFLPIEISVPIEYFGISLDNYTQSWEGYNMELHQLLEKALLVPLYLWILWAIPANVDVV
jgi:hypothetical protein